MSSEIGDGRGAIGTEEARVALAFAVRVARAVSVAVVHVVAHVGSDTLALAVRISLAVQVALLDEVLNELHRKIRLVCWHHMAGLRHDDRCEVFVVAIPAASQLLITELVDILVDLPRLQVKHLTIIEIDPLDPFKL